MKHFLFFTFTVFLLFCCNITGQNINSSIIKELNSSKPGEGSIRIMQDESINNDVASYATSSDSMKVIRLSNDMINGFKIQVFAGNNQNASKMEAEEKQRRLRQEFPEHQALISYNSPSWRLRVGNFVTRNEAEAFLVELKKAFPSFSREMYIVDDVIRRPLNR